MSRARMPDLSLEELSRRTGASRDELQAWRDRGLIGTPGADAFGPDDFERTRLVALCLRRGFELDALVRAEEQEPGFLRHFLEQIFPDGIGATYSVTEAATMTGLDVDLLRRLRETAGETAEAIYAE